ncbi:MAG TPA: hypothetical protein VGO62_18085 [Myxococcota bacterium]
MRIAIVTASAFALAAVACGNPSTDKNVDNAIDERAALLPTPANGLALVMPVDKVIPAGGDQMWCWVPELPAGALAADQLVVHADGAQGAGGHHVFVYMSAIPRKAGDVFDCTNVEEMVTMTPLLAPVTASSPTFGKTLPPGYAIRMPKDATLVVQSHYVNVKDQAIRIKDNVTLTYADPGADVVEAAYWTQSLTDFSIPEGEHSITTTCQMQGDLAALSVLGHMHEWGKNFSFTVTPAAGGDAAPIYSVPDWTAQYRDSPPLTVYPEGQPLVMHDGDTLTMTCAYNNDTGADLKFPFEMCTTFGAYAPARPDGFVLCDSTGENLDLGL